MAHPTTHHPRYDRDGHPYFHNAIVPAPLICVSSPPSNMCPDMSTLPISSTVYSEDLPELVRSPSSRSDTNGPLLQFSPTSSLRRLQSISEHYDSRAGSSTQFSPRTSPLSPQMWRAPPSYPAPSVRTTSTDSSSPSSESRPNRESSLRESPLLGGLFTRKKKKEITKKAVLDPLPDALSFVFSSAGNNLTLWHKNGHSLIHIKIASWESKRLDLRHTLPAQDPDRGLNIKLVAEGDGWISAVIYRKRV
jgi:hypothetical protein